MPDIKNLKITMKTGGKVEAAENIEQSEGWFTAPWRLISAGTWWMSSNVGPVLIEYPEEVLKTALEKYNNLPLHVDHHDALPTWLGKVQNPVWREANGEVPAGINAMVSVSEKRDEKLGIDAILGIQSGVMGNGSIGQTTRTEMSHEFEDWWQFYEMMGREVDGEIVRLICREIVGVREFSLVNTGADPNATIQTKLNKSVKEEDGMKEFLIQMAKVYGLPNTASESDIIAAARANLEKAQVFDEQLEEIRTKAQANLNALKEAGKELNPMFGDMLKAEDPKTIRFVASEIEAKLEAEIPLSGRASVQATETQVKQSTPKKSVENPRGW